ncbi:malate synthase A [Geminicoccaceae bacterium 1502E]|nr:malate synthase A [Geminicoccaceae bacterium 1502E]
MAFPTVPGLEMKGAAAAGFEAILSAEALAFLVDLERRFRDERKRLLAAREERQKRIDAGELPGFLPETSAIRNGEWKVAPIPADLQNRRVEITGPVDRKMVINALNSGASCYMADFEDSTTPLWTNQVQGQINLRDAIARKVDFTDPSSGKSYKLADETATLLVRPRGWHLSEKHMLVDGEPMSGGLFDFGLYFFHNVKELTSRGSGPYFYLPKMESHLEARLWNNVFLHAQQALGVPVGTIKATVLIETILATFELDEIIYELREHMAGLNCGRWDYIFSYIKRFRNHPDRMLPDRAEVTMTVPFMRAYSRLVIKTCHRRGCFAMGGMAAQIPIKTDPKKNEEAMAKVRADKEREANDGHDGTWVAHPGLVPIAKEIFDRVMPEPNQVESGKQADLTVSAEELIAAPKGSITEAGLRMNCNVGIGYTEAWLRGIGCVPLHNLMEDAATAEISRAQVWQWRRHKAKLDDGRTVDTALIRKTVEQELETIAKEVGDNRWKGGRWNDAAKLFLELVERDDFVEFLTLPAYERVVAEGG